MRVAIDSHRLLMLIPDTLSGGKEYHFLISGYPVVAHGDTGLFIYQKRQRRLIHLKNLSEGMQVCFVQ